MMNVKFRSKNVDRIEAMTKLYSLIFAVLMNVNKPLLQTIIYLNENFEDIYDATVTDVEVYEYIFDELNISYKAI